MKVCIYVNLYTHMHVYMHIYQRRFCALHVDSKQCAKKFNTPQHTAAHSDTLQHTVPRCTTLQQVQITPPSTSTLSAQGLAPFPEATQTVRRLIERDKEKEREERDWKSERESV